MALAGTAVAAQGGPLSKKDYIVAADNVCRQADQLREEAAQGAFAETQPGQEPTSDQLAEYVAAITPINDQQLDSLRALPAPRADRKKVKKIYKLVEQAFDKIDSDPNLILTIDVVFAKADKAARKYGFHVCGAETSD
jgi:hypothetical protein